MGATPRKMRIARFGEEVDVRRAKHFIVACAVLAIGCRLFTCAVACAAEALSAEADPSPPKLKAEDYRALLDELAAERKHIDELEQKVRALEASNSKLEQSQTALQTDTSQTEKQVVQIQKTLGQQLGPFQFGDRVNSFLGQHTFSLVGSVATGFNYSHLAGRNDYTLDFELNPIIVLPAGEGAVAVDVLLRLRPAAINIRD